MPVGGLGWGWRGQSDVTQSCPILCDPVGRSPPGFSIHGIFQARVLEWVAISFSRRSSRPRDWTWVSCIAGRRFTLWATREAGGPKDPSKSMCSRSSAFQNLRLPGDEGECICGCWESYPEIHRQGHEKRGPFHQAHFPTNKSPFPRSKPGLQLEALWTCMSSTRAVSHLWLQSHCNVAGPKGAVLLSVKYTPNLQGCKMSH